MFVHRSNRLEVLADELARVLAVPLSSPLAAEVVVVQSKGMERWLSMALASRLGVFAGAEFPFPRSFVERVIASVFGAEKRENEDPFARGELTWSVAAALPDLLQRPELSDLRAYLAHDPTGEKRLELSTKIGDVFDQYPVYRPDLVTSWEGGGGTGWQPLLWRALVARRGATHVAARARRFFDRMLDLRELPAEIPERVSLFGVALLPPFYLDVLETLSRHRDVHLFLFSPSREHWAEIRSRREIARAMIASDQSEEALGLSLGHPLLASLGKLGRDYQFVLESHSDYVESERDLYVEPERRTMLGGLASDILALVHRGPRSATARPVPLAPHDTSVELHACHGPMREVEVLRDRLLALFEEDTTLEPRDVIVMTPDVATYAPLVTAVLGGIPGAPGAIPFRIADRGARAASEVQGAFLALLDVAESRITASGVMDLLAMRPLRDALSLSEDDAAELRGLVEDSGVRWGLDRAHRSREGQPAAEEGTWRFGLDRLLVGYALPLEERAMFGGVLPHDDVEGSRAILVGKLATFVENISRLAESVRQPSTVSSWRAIFESTIERHFSHEDAGGEDADELRKSFAEIERRAIAGGFTETLPLRSMKRELVTLLDAGASAHDFLAGGVTFCALLPMRSIPFRVVCLVGMSDGAFPRSERPVSFDLVAAKRRRGDRSVRDEDRYLFLEAILSARERLLITYVGRSLHDGAELPPAVVVNELTETLAESFFVPGDEREGALLRRIRVEHPLQPFSRRYFDGRDPRLESFSLMHLEGARALAGTRKVAPPLVQKPLPAPREMTRVIALGDLESFLGNPSRFFLERRLGLRLPRDLEVLQDREPIVLNALERYGVRDDLLARALDGQPMDEALALSRGRGRLPLGAMGELAFGGIAADATRIANATLGARGGERLPLRRIDVTVGDTRLTGALRDLYPAAQVMQRAGRHRARMLLSAWVRHLALQLVRSGDDPQETAVVARDASGKHLVTRFAPPADAALVLADLVELFRFAETTPLALFPNSALAYATALEGDSPSPAKALSAAQGEWRTDTPQAGPGESEDAHVSRLIGARADLTAELRILGLPGEPTFADLATRVFGPLLRHRSADS